MIFMHTGNPGAGKTARAVDMVFAMREKGEARPIVVIGINGFEPPEGVKVIENPNDWESLDDGTIVIIDEVQRWWPSNGKREPIPPVKALSTHRHRGFDFHLVTQRPTMVHTWIRGLVETHIHYERKYWTQACKTFRWDGACVDDPTSTAKRKLAVTGVSKLPTRAFAHYKSATMHVSKPHVPKTAYMLLVLPVLIVGLFYVVKVVMAEASTVEGTEKAKQSQHTATATMTNGVAAANALGNPPGAKPDRPKTPAEWIAWQTPRVPGIPWSAPMYDGAQPSEMPQVFCVLIEDRDCRCMTEQGSRWDVTQVMCKRIAREGLYNPFKPRSQVAATP